MMKALLMLAVTALTLSANLAHASLQPDVPAEASLMGQTLFISTDAADVLYERLNAKEIFNDDEIKGTLTKTARGISCTRHMNGSDTVCIIKIGKSGVLPK